MKLYNEAVLILVGDRDGSEDGLTFAFRFTDASISIPNQGMLNFVLLHFVMSGLVFLYKEIGMVFL